MCVIMIANKVRPTEEMITRAWDHNSHGFGIAYREGRGDKLEVVWQKGIMKLEDAKEAIAKAPLPFVCHFRVASVGGVQEALTHPFPIGPEGSLALTGRTKGGVLFHNGHWGAWNEKALDAAIHTNSQIPEGSAWSDSRAMAWMVHLFGKSLMDLLPSQKGVIVTPQNFSIFTGGGWEKINDVWCSNDYFWGGRRHTSHNSNSSYSTVGNYGKMCSRGKCTNRPMVDKDICWSCNDKDKKAAETSSETSSVGQSRTVVESVTGGTSRGPLAKMFSVQEVERFYKMRLVSKSKLKAYRKANSSSGEKGNRGERALKQMRELSVEIAEKLETGSTN